MTTNKHDLDIDYILDWFYLGDEDKYTPEAWASHRTQAKSNIISLIESIGEELIGSNEPDMPYMGEDDRSHQPDPSAFSRNQVRNTQREKLNTIIKRLKDE